MTPLLEITNLHAGYDEGSVLHGVSMAVDEGSITTLLGRNGVGKTTTLRAIMGIIQSHSGSIWFQGKDLVGRKPFEVYTEGIGMVMEDRGIFANLTVEENLQAPVITDSETEWSVEEIFEMFPMLRTHRHSDGGNLSGGQQQMLTFGRALRGGPDLLLLDEVTEGLAPKIVEDIADIVKRIANQDTTVLLVEQNVPLALELGSYHYVMDSGEIVFEGSTQEVEASDDLERYLGIHAREQ